MLRLLLVKCAFFFALTVGAATTVVKNLAELDKANKMARPGDTILLQNGDWKNVTISLDCSGSANQPIVFKAAVPGKVSISGQSKLRLGGNFIVVEGLNFINGFAGSDAVIDFRINKDKLANNCRVTNCMVNDYNNLKRLDENYWVSFSGKKNRVDHCSFLNKKNLGVLIAVILDDDRSRENFHSIDHNYFGTRLPLASNGGEIIRVGISQHCQFNSNTQITDNYFDNCDGETEIISVKSCSNIVRNNLFKECQGGVVLRHGDNNTVENNIFLGNGKEGTGGVRIINKGQWVVNNLFYECRGTDFRSPLSIMNGVPNSPANRYVPVTDAVIANNSFVNCTPISFGEGSDTERSVAPDHVFFEKNIFYNSKDSIIYRSYDDIGGIHFVQNVTSIQVKQRLTTGFAKANMKTVKTPNAFIPAVISNAVNNHDDSLAKAGSQRLSGKINSHPGFSDAATVLRIEANAYKNCGISWLAKEVHTQADIASETTAVINCRNTEDLLAGIEKNKYKNVIINLTGAQYHFTAPIQVNSNLKLISGSKKEISFTSSFDNSHIFEITGNSSLALTGLHLNLSGILHNIFITTDTSGSSGHIAFIAKNCMITNLNTSFFDAFKSSVADSIIVTGNTFINNKGLLFNLAHETDKKGYYNAEQIKITGNTITNQEGALLSLVRSGNDESTMGPILVLSGNKTNNCVNSGQQAFIHLYGVQHSYIEKNTFKKTGSGSALILFEDAVRGDHLLRNNDFSESGTITRDKYVRN